MSIYRRFLAYVSFLFFSFQGFAQVSGNLTAPGQLTFGLNAGWSYQTSDIKTNFDGFGVGATLAKNLFYRPDAPLAFDLRGRLLFARQYGYDPFLDTDIANNTALNGTGQLDYLNYPNALNEPIGFVYQNHQTTLGELSLEGVFTLNRLKERTGIIAALYGGIGLDWYRTKIDQANLDGAYYEGYANIDENAPENTILRDLQNTVWDGNFETLADGYEGVGKLDVMPSVGVELGYQLTPGFSITAGHRLTFSGNDLLDGNQWENANNDLYHYTTLGLNWSIGNTNRTKKGKAPIIKLTEPRTNPHRSTSINGIVRAEILHINSVADITCTVNGRSAPFQFTGETFYLSFYLDPGRNEVTIRASNPYGSDAKVVIFILEGTDVIVNPPPSSIPRPEVLITSPGGAQYTTTEYNQVIRAEIRHVASKNDVEFLVNGQAVRSFTYDPSRDQFVSTINLNYGETEVRIIGRNASGLDEDRLIILREDPRRIPVVDIYQPGSDPFETNTPNQTVRANLENINSRTYLSVYVNGRAISNWQYGSGRVTLNLDLVPGRNTVRISANTPDGFAEDETTLIYTVAPSGFTPPTVNITRPLEQTITVDAENYNLKATTDYITSKNQIDFTVNGQRITNYSFNSKNGSLSANLTLRQGSNNIRITVSNSDGTAQDDANIRYIPPIQSQQPPEVTIQSPADNSTVESNRITLQAIAKYVSQKQDVELTLNGRVLSSFSFQPVSGSLSANLTLVEGENFIAVRGTNRDGSDEDAIRVVYRPASPPVVRFTRPSGSSANTSSPTYEVEAEVKNVSTKSQLKFTINGLQSNNFSINGEQFKATVDLRSGNNQLVLEATNSDGSDQDNVSIRYTPTPAPTVTITNPSDGATITSTQTNLEATVTNVNAKSEVTLLVNGRETTAFSWSNNKVRANINLRTGQNTILVKVQNAGGNDQDQVKINYAPKTPPTVKITIPSDGAQVEKNQISVQAAITNINLKSQVVFTFNGRVTSSFTLSNDQVQANLRLRSGQNTINIKVTNKDGSAEDQIRVIYKEPVVQPEVSFITPQRPGGKETRSAYTFKASVKGVDQKSQIKVRVNGANFSNFTFDAGDQTVTGQINLKKGTNQLQVEASNEAGTDRANTTIILESNAPPITGNESPTIEITNVSQPATNPMNPNVAASTLTAKTSKVTQKNQIKVTINGALVTDFTFSPNKQEIEANLSLERGDNLIKVEVSNRAGSDEDSMNIEF